MVAICTHLGCTPIWHAAVFPLPASGLANAQRETSAKVHGEKNPVDQALGRGEDVQAGEERIHCINHTAWEYEENVYEIPTVSLCLCHPYVSSVCVWYGWRGLLAIEVTGLST